MGWLTRVYRISGLNGRLYSSNPTWSEGYFLQADDAAGDLALRAGGIETSADLDAAIALLDLRAERFHLALCLQVGRPLKVVLIASEQPDVGPPGGVTARTSFDLGDKASGDLLPRSAPSILPQLHEHAARWIYTLSETSELSRFRDEVIKRLYLIIEEMWTDFRPFATPAQVKQESDVKLVRDFVSHSPCERRKVCAFIQVRLPSAVISQSPLRVRFDRTKVEHENFVGSYEPIARDLVRVLLDRELRRLPQV